MSKAFSRIVHQKERGKNGRGGGTLNARCPIAGRPTKSKMARKTILGLMRINGRKADRHGVEKTAARGSNRMRSPDHDARLRREEKKKRSVFRERGEEKGARGVSTSKVRNCLYDILPWQRKEGQLMCRGGKAHTIAAMRARRQDSRGELGSAHGKGGGQGESREESHPYQEEGISFRE